MTNNCGHGYLWCRSSLTVCGSSCTSWLSMCCGGSDCWGIRRSWLHSGGCYLLSSIFRDATWEQWVLLVFTGQLKEGNVEGNSLTMLSVPTGPNSSNLISVCSDHSLTLHLQDVMSVLHIQTHLWIAQGIIAQSIASKQHMVASEWIIGWW
jgi:hypothetical protein